MAKTKVSPASKFLLLLSAIANRDSELATQQLQAYLNSSGLTPGLNLLDCLPEVFAELASDRCDFGAVALLLSRAAEEAQGIYDSSGTKEMYPGAFSDTVEPDAEGDSLEELRGVREFDDEVEPTFSDDEITALPAADSDISLGGIGSAGIDLTQLSPEELQGSRGFDEEPTDPAPPCFIIGLAHPTGSADVTEAEPSESGINLSQPSDSGISLRDLKSEELPLTFDHEEVRRDFEGEQTGNGEINLPDSLKGDEPDGDEAK